MSSCFYKLFGCLKLVVFNIEHKIEHIIVTPKYIIVDYVILLYSWFRGLKIDIIGKSWKIFLIQLLKFVLILPFNKNIKNF